MVLYIIGMCCMCVEVLLVLMYCVVMGSFVCVVVLTSVGVYCIHVAVLRVLLFCVIGKVFCVCCVVLGYRGVV